MEQWEYLTRFIEANTQKVTSSGFMGTMDSEETPIYSPEALMPELNRLGKKGWELVHMEPAYIGKNHDVLIQEGGGSRRWTNNYFCVFKRKI